VALQKVGGATQVVRLAGRDREPQRPAAGIGEHVDLGGQSASGAPQRLVARPPFPLAAC
jgi:hypothetical protein